MPSALKIQRLCEFVRLAQVLALVTVSASAIGCGSGKKGSEPLDCGPADQRGSYMAPLPNDQTANLFLDSKFDQNPDLKKEAGAAIDTWNELGSAVTGRMFFHLENSPVNTGGPSSQTDCNDIQGDAGSFAILLDQSDADQPDSHWRSLGLSNSDLGVTIRCYNTQDQTLLKQVIVINTRFTQADFHSIILHELGHAVGLDHSCNAQGNSSSFVGCSNLGSDPNHPYRKAVMYPQLLPVSLGISGSNSSPSSTSGAFSPSEFALEQKTVLQPNDRDRTGCRYKN